MIFEGRRDKYNYIRLTARIIHEDKGFDANVNFCLDTGSPCSYLSFEQATILGIIFDELEKEKNLTRIAGMECHCYILKDSLILLRESTGKLYRQQFSPFRVLEPAQNDGDKLPVPGILGYDFLVRFNLVVGGARFGNRIYLTDQRVGVLES